MGATCSEEKKYRFKNFVVSVYPDDVHAGPDEEALGTLNSYVASNPERIPRVCRKISKILKSHLQKGKKDRVMVSVKMLRSLIEKSVAVEGFVAHSVDICKILLAEAESAYHIGAADILCILCYKLSLSPASESSCRLVLDSKDQLIPPLQKMASEGLASVNEKSTAHYNRYAAILALGHIAVCLEGALSNDTREMISPLLMNLLLLVREKEKAGIRDASETVGGAQDSEVPPPTSAILPEKDPFTAYKKACCFAIGAVAGCVTSAEVDVFLTRVISFLDTKKGWSVYSVPILIFRALTEAMENRPQLLGFSVYQCLCSIGMENTDPIVRIGILRSLTECVLVVPMTGGRPQELQTYILSVMKLPLTTGERYDLATSEALVELTAALMLSTYKRRNTSQLQFILAALLEALTELEKVDEACTLNALRCMAVASPYVRTAPLSDRGSINVVGVLLHFLDGENDQQRTMAARILRGVLAGVPADGSEEVSTALLGTDENDIHFAQEWLWRMMEDISSVTPRCLVQLSNTFIALCNGYGVLSFPFAFTWLYHVQTVFATESTSPLGRAWLHMILLCVISLGESFELPKLKAYGEDILARRHAAEECSPYFKLERVLPSRPSEKFTLSGLTTESRTKKEILPFESSLPPVTKLLSFDFITSILVDSERDDICTVFHTTAADLKATVERVCFQKDSVAQQRQISQAAVVPAVDPLPAPFRLTTQETPAAAVQLVDVEIVVVASTDGAKSDENAMPQVKGEKLEDRIANILQHFNVNEDTPLPRPSVGEAPLPLFEAEDPAERSVQSAISDDKESSEDMENELLFDNSRKGSYSLSNEKHSAMGREVGQLPFHQTWTHTLPSSQHVTVN